MKYCTECLIQPASPRSRLGLCAECAHKRLMDQSNARAKRRYQKQMLAKKEQMAIKETHGLVCARAYPDQVQRVREWFQELEKRIEAPEEEENHQYHCQSLGSWIYGRYEDISSEWERILFGYETIVENACDPTLSYLDFKPEIKAAMRQAVVLNRLLHIIISLIDYYNRNVLNFQSEKLGDYIRELTEAIAVGGDHA